MVRKNEDILELSVSNLTGCYVVSECITRLFLFLYLYLYL